MKNLSYLLFFLVSLQVCQKANAQTDYLPGLDVNQRYVMGTACKLGIYITAAAGNNWTITRSSAGSWLTPAVSSGSGQGVVYINFSANPLSVTRKDSITITCVTTVKRIVFNQLVAQCDDYCCADCLSGNSNTGSFDTINLPKKLSSKRTLSSMVGVNAGAEWDNFNGTNRLNPFKEVASYARSFHQMDKDYPLGAPCKNPGNFAAVACPFNTTNCWGVPTSTMASYYHRYKFGWRDTAGFKDIHAALMAYPGRSFPNTWYTMQEWGSATDTSVIRTKAKQYTIEFAKNHAPRKTDCATCDSVVTVLQVGNEPWGSPGRLAYHSILRGTIQGLSEYYQSSNPANWRIKLVPAATQASTPQHIWRNNSISSGDYVDSLLPGDVYPYLLALNTHQYSFDKNANAEKDTIYPEATYSAFHRIKAMLKWRNNHSSAVVRALPVWLTEFGWDSKRYNTATGQFNLPGSLGVGEEAQAVYLVRSVLMLSRWGIDKATIYQSVDDDFGVGNADNYNSSGMVKFLYNGSGQVTNVIKKKSFHAMRKVKTLLGNHIYLDAISETDNGTYAYILGDTLGKPTHLVIWTAKNINNNSAPQNNTQNVSVTLPGTMTINGADSAFRLDYEIFNGTAYTKFLNSQVLSGTSIIASPVPLVLKLSVGSCSYNLATGQLENCGSCSTLTVSSCPSSFTVNSGTVVTWADPTGTSSCGTSCPTTISGYTNLGDFNGNRYFKSTTPLTWDAAAADAVNKGGKLVSVNTSGESGFINGFVGFDVPYFIGALKNSSNIYNWVDGTSISFNNWAAGEPNTANTRGYIVKWSGGMTAPKWFTENNGPIRNYFIEIPCTANNTVTVTRTDNGPAKGTAWPAGTYTVNYLLSNSCGCSKTCSFVVTVTGTCPYPLIAGYDTIGKYNNHKYYMSQSATLTWDQAQTAAVQNGGFLVSIESSAESTFINSKVSPNANVPYFIGAIKNAGNFTWVNNSAITFTNWGTSEPNLANNRSYIVRWTGMASPQWFTENNGALRKYIIEIPCPGSGNANRSAGGATVLEVSAETEVEIYPNPAVKTLTVILPAAHSYNKLEITDALGRIVETIPVANKRIQQVNTASLVPGVYVIRISGTDGKVYTHKMVKVKE